MKNVELIYSYAGDQIGDLWPYCIDGLRFSKLRNAVGDMSFNISLQALAAWCRARNFDIPRTFTPIKSSAVLYIDGNPVVGGWLSATPAFSLGQSPDATATMVFTDWLGLTAGAYLHPVDTYSGQFQIVAQNYLNQVLARASAAGAAWPLSYDGGDTMASVQGTIDSLKPLKDFLIERTDNATGTGEFDVYFDAYGGMQVRQNYGHDITASAIFVYPENSSRYGIKQIDFPEWSNYISDYYLTGSGNGYGDSGTAITSQQFNAATRANTGYFEGASAESDINQQATLDAKATGYLFGTDKQFAAPTFTLDCDNFNLWAHEDGGDLWLGDTVRVMLSGWAAEIIPLSVDQNMRIAGIEATIDKQNHIEAKLTMTACTSPESLPRQIAKMQKELLALKGSAS